MDKQYQITVSEEQARVIQTALDMFMRVGIGQLHSVWDELSILASEAHGGDFDWTTWRGNIQDANTVLSRFFPFNMNNGSYGIHNKLVSERTKMAIDIHDVIRHRISWDLANADGSRNWSKMYGVNYDNPRQLSTHPLPTIKKVEE